jgi:uncharacterized phage-associated protein
MAKTDDVAAAILSATGEVTTMKLQKLLYYSQAWHLTFTGTPLFPSEVQAWLQGPVVPDIHRQVRRRYFVAGLPSGDATALSESERRTIEWVLGKYGSFTAEALSAMTHLESPWRLARGIAGDDEATDTPISHDVMASYYGRQRSSPNVAVAQVAASAALEGELLDQGWHDVLLAVANDERSADSVVAEEIARARRQG